MTGKTDIYNGLEQAELDAASAAPSISIIVNGEGRTVPRGCSVIDLLNRLGLPKDRVAVELNRSIVRKRDWAATIVPVDGRLEVVEFVGGG